MVYKDSQWDYHWRYWIKNVLFPLQVSQLSTGETYENFIKVPKGPLPHRELSQYILIESSEMEEMTAISIRNEIGKKYIIVE